MIDMKEKFEERFSSCNKFYSSRYFKLIEYLKNIDCTDKYCENHHILPRSLFPEYVDSEWNLVRIPARWHYLLHFILAKAVGGKMWFAFNNMLRVLTKSQRRGILYERSRIYIGKQISQMNSGRKKSAAEIQKMSERRKGIPLSEETKQKMRKPKTNKENYKKYVKTEEHRRNLSKSQKGKPKPYRDGRVNGMKGKTQTEYQKRRVKEALTGQIPWNKGKRAPQCSHPGYIHDEAYYERMSELIKTMKWMNNGIVNKRIKPENINQYLEDGWVLGRGWI